MTARNGCVLALVAALAASSTQLPAAEMSGTPPSLTPSLRAPLGEPKASRTPALRLSADTGDVVTLSSLTLEEEWMGGTSWIRSAKEARRILLADGRTLLVDAKTAPGEYIQSDGARLWVRPGNRYPVLCEFEASKARVLRFGVETSALVGFLCTPLGGAPSAASYAVAIRNPRSGSQLTEADSTLALECPVRGPLEWGLRVSAERKTPFVVTWFAYPKELPGQAKTSATEWNKGRFEWSLARTGTTRTYPIAHRVSSEALAEGLRLIGSVEVDPSTWSLRSVSNGSGR